MHALYQEADALSKTVIEAAIEVHRHYGEGVLESIYVKSLSRELELRGHRVAEEVPCVIDYKGRTFRETIRCDLLVDDCLIVEAKSVEPCDLQRYRMQLLSYMKLLNKPLGLVINFGESTLGKRAIRRVILKGADAPSVVDKAFDADVAAPEINSAPERYSARAGADISGATMATFASKPPTTNH